MLVRGVLFFMNLKQLQYFRALAKTQHYTKAAAQLYITQPSLSQAISELEKELNIKLFEKEGRNIKLTKYGQYYLTYVEKGLNVLEQGEKNLHKLSSIDSGEIEVGYIYNLAGDCLPSIIQAFVESIDGGNITFSCLQGTTRQILDGLKEEKYDLAFCTYLENEPEIEFIPLEKKEVVLIAHKDHELVNRQNIHIDDIKDYKFVFFNKTSSLRQAIDKECSKAGFALNIACEVAEDNALIGLVAAKQGIGIIPRGPELESYDIKILHTEKPIFEQMIYMATIKKKYIPPLVERFRNFVIQRYQFQNR